MIRNKGRKDIPFAQIANETLCDFSISHAARSILFYLLHLPEDWEVSVKHVVSTTGNNRQSVERWINELIEAGYMVRNPQVRNDDGTMGSGGFDVFGRPMTKNPSTVATDDEKPINGSVELTDDVFTDDGKPIIIQISNTNKEEKNKEEIETDWIERYELVAASWNEFASKLNLPNVRTPLNDKRKKGIRKKWGALWPQIDAVYTGIRRSEWLSGRGAWAGANFDFIWVQADKWEKILEGQYDKGGRGQVITSKPISTFKPPPRPQTSGRPINWETEFEQARREAAGS